MSKEKFEKNVRNIPVSFRLTEEESKKLKQCAAACGISRCRIYAAVMQGQCSAATAAERVLGAAECSLRGTRRLSNVHPLLSRRRRNL